MSTDRRVAIVTSGGRAIALRLAQDGLDIVINGPEPNALHATSAEVETSGRSALATMGRSLGLE